MNNRIFVDSSVLIEPLQKRKVEFYIDRVIANIDNCCINSIVISEFLYKYIGLQNMNSPRAIQDRQEVALALEDYFTKEILQHYQYLETNHLIVGLVPRFMAKYNLLPNDAIILATCKIHNITTIASHDADFIVPCEQEGITLLRED